MAILTGSLATPEFHLATLNVLARTDDTTSEGEVHVCDAPGSVLDALCTFSFIVLLPYEVNTIVYPI